MISYIYLFKILQMYSLRDCFKEIFGLHAVSNNQWQCYFYSKCTWSLWATAQWDIKISFGISKFYESSTEETSEKPIYPCRYLYTVIYCKWKQICVICYVYFDWL